MKDLFLTILEQSMAASVLICAALLLRLIFSRVRRSVLTWMWLLVAVRLLLPITLETEYSMMPLYGPSETILGTVTDEKHLPAVSDVETGFVSAPSSALTPITLPEDAVVHTIPYTANPNVTDEKPSSSDWLLYGSAVWMGGMVVGVLYAVLSYLRLKKQTAVSIPGGDGIRFCDGIGTPFIIGFFKPVICIPASGWSAENLRAVLFHERAHLARLDHLTKPFAFLICCVHWFNPLVWIAYGAFCRDLELACDERVTRSMQPEEKRAYAEALLACSCDARPRSAHCAALAFGEVGVSMRIRRVLDGKRAGLVLTLVCIAVIIFVVLAFATTPRVLPSDIYHQNGFRVTAIAEDLDMEFIVPLDDLDERAFTDEGQHFDDGEVVIHKAGATTVSLVHVCYRENKSPLTENNSPTVNFTFRFSYDDLKNNNVITMLSRPNYEGKEQTDLSVALGMVSDTLTIDGTYIDNAIRSGGHGHGTEVSVYVDAAINLSQSDEMRFSMTGFCELSYEIGEPNAAEDMAHLIGGPVYGQSDPILGRVYTEETVQAYVADRCLYMTPLSSFVPISGSDGNLYALVRDENGDLTTDFGRYNRDEGRNRISFDVGEGWMPFPYTTDEWKALFSVFEAPDLSRYESIRCLKLHRNDMLLSLDDELWYCKTDGLSDGGTQMWSIYSLIPEREKGEAFWCDAPMLNHTRSHFLFQFDIPGLTTLTLTTESGTMLKNGETVQQLKLTDGITMAFDPVGICNEISICAETDENTAPIWGTVYVEEYQKNGDGRTYYRASVTGTGFTIANDSADGAIITYQE